VSLSCVREVPLVTLHCVWSVDGEPVMCTGSPAGHIALWDLEKRKLRSEIRAAHNAPVTGMKCLPSQPILVTSSPDNSLKVCLSFVFISMLLLSMVVWLLSHNAVHLPSELSHC